MVCAAAGKGAAVGEGEEGEEGGEGGEVHCWIGGWIDGSLVGSFSQRKGVLSWGLVAGASWCGSLGVGRLELGGERGGCCVLV